MTDGLYDKFQLIDGIIVQIDALTDARGVEKCKIILDAIGKLTALKKGLQDDDAEQQRKLDTLREELRRVTQPDGGDDTETIDGKTYKIGVPGGQ